MKSLTRSETAQWLMQRDHFAILSHNKPDGDTSGSAALLCLGLRSLGKQAYVVENPELTDRYRDLHEGITKSQAEPEDTIVSVDIPAINMIPEAFRQYLGRIELRIDHHGRAQSFTEYELVDPCMGACAELIYDVLMEMGVTLDQDMARALYTAVSTDTGCFRYVHNAHSFLVAAACAETGLDLFPINQRLHDTNTRSKLRMHGWIVENTRLLQNGKVAICVLPAHVERELEVTEDDMENIAAFPRTIEGVCIAAMLREDRNGNAKLSVRAVPGYDSAAVCVKFGGGGHTGAAGADTKLPMAQAAEAVEKVLLELEYGE